MTLALSKIGLFAVLGPTFGLIVGYGLGAYKAWVARKIPARNDRDRSI